MKQVTDAEGRTRTRLETWGEIAHHLGVEVRTAQRWEGRMGVPVRRLEGSQAVFAFVDELDSWWQSREIKPADPLPGAAATPPESDPPASVPEPAPDSALARRRLTPRVAVMALAATVFASLALAIAARVTSSPRPEPAAIGLEGNRLVAVDAGGSRLWTHEFGQPTAQIQTGFRDQMPPLWQRIDADGDGTDEIVVVVAHPRDDRSPRESVYCFALDGRLRFSYTPEIALSFGQQRFEAPWQVIDVEAVHGGGLWLSLANAPWWPGVVVSLDAQGAATLRFTQPGVVYVLRSMREAGRTLVLASGTNNDFGAASLAAIDPHGPPASAPPGRDERYACADCPAGQPVHYLLFEPSPANSAAGLTYNRADSLTVDADIAVSVLESEHAAIAYRLSRDLRLLSAMPSDPYWSPALRAGHEDAFKDDPLTARLRVWTASGWTAAELPYARAHPAPTTAEPRH